MEGSRNKRTQHTKLKIRSKKNHVPVYLLLMVRRIEAKLLLLKWEYNLAYKLWPVENSQEGLRLFKCQMQKKE